MKNLSLFLVLCTLPVVQASAMYQDEENASHQKTRQENPDSPLNRTNSVLQATPSDGAEQGTIALLDRKIDDQNFKTIIENAEKNKDDTLLFHLFKKDNDAHKLNQKVTNLKEVLFFFTLGLLLKCAVQTLKGESYTTPLKGSIAELQSWKMGDRLITDPIDKLNGIYDFLGKNQCINRDSIALIQPLLRERGTNYFAQPMGICPEYTFTYPEFNVHGAVHNWEIPRSYFLGEHDYWQPSDQGLYSTDLDTIVKFKDGSSVTVKRSDDPESHDKKVDIGILEQDSDGKTKETFIKCQKDKGPISNEICIEKTDYANKRVQKRDQAIKKRMDRDK